MNTGGGMRWYARLLRLYPRWFRRRYEAQMLADFSDLIERRNVLRAWSIVAGDLVVSLPREWFAMARHGAGSGNASGLLRDVRYALRLFVRSPGFSLVVVLTLTVGIGINVAMFSVANAVLFSPLPYHDADRIAVLWNRHPNTDAEKVLISGPDLVDYQNQVVSLTDWAYTHNASDQTLNDGARAEQIDVGYVSWNLFSFLGTAAILGRTFTEEDDRLLGTGSEARPAVLSHAIWTRRYGQDRDILGRTISIGGRPVTVIGVLPPEFQLVLPYEEGGAMSNNANDRPDVWRILPERGMETFPRGVGILRVIARLGEDVSIHQAQDELDAVATRLREAHSIHSERGTEIDLVPLHADIVGSVRATILALFGAVAVVLLLACANVANLVSVRSTHRQNEISIRRALGAGRRRIVRQLLAENAVLAAAGSLLGVGFAAILIKSIVALAPPSVPLLDRVGIDARAVGFAVLAGVLATVLVGIFPAFRASGTRIGTQRLTTAAARHGAGNRFRSITVTAEIALSLVLLIGGGLLLKSFLMIQRAQLGFDPGPIVTARVAIGHGGYDDDEVRNRYWDALARQIEEIPVVSRAALVSQIPFGGMGAELPYSDAGRETSDWGRYVAHLTQVTPGYFETIGAITLEGRTFGDTDLTRDDVAVIDDIAAERMFGGESAVGRRIVMQLPGQDEPDELEIVGVVQHVRHSNTNGSEREVIYRPARNNWVMAVVASVEGEPAAAIQQIERAAAELDPDVPMFDTRPLVDYVTERNATTRFAMTLASAFGCIALLLSAVGLYGVIAYAVEQRTSEIGLRMALGATPGGIAKLILAYGGWIAAAGLAGGLIAAVGVSRLLQGMLVDVPARDPATFAIVTLVLGVTTMLAAWVPARRAARLDPLDTLRQPG